MCRTLVIALPHVVQFCALLIIVINQYQYITIGEEMTTLGKIGEYCAASEEWPQYVECLEFFLIANKVMEADLKCVIGPHTFKLLQNMLTLDKLGGKSYAELVNVLTDHFSLKPSKIAQHLKFYSCSKKPGESISKFMAELHAIAEYCNFGPSLDAMIQIEWCEESRIMQSKKITSRK